MKLNQITKIGILSFFFFTKCTVGPDYQKIVTDRPEFFKETKSGNWKTAEPKDDIFKGKWWEIYNDPYLNELEEQIETTNHNILASIAQMDQAQALLGQSKSNYFPTIGANSGITRQRQGSGYSQNPTETTNYSVNLNATWIPDLWGNIRRSVEANEAAFQASEAQVENIKLSVHASLAQYYFQLRTVDKNQVILNEIAECTKRQLEMIYRSKELGTANSIEVQKLESQYDLAKLNAEDNSILREQYEHAIAIILGKSPAEFSLEIKNTNIQIPILPMVLPSELLERRPDIAQAERLVAQANAQIGIAKAAYFPNLNLSSNVGYSSNDISNLFTLPTLIWSVGASLAETIFDAGSRKDKVEAAEANYRAVVNQYKQTVLQALQNVEDNLSAFNHLKSEELFQFNSMNKIESIYNLSNEQFEQGIINNIDLLTAKINLQNSKKSLNDLINKRVLNSVNLIASLGGGWKQFFMK
ncbi:efflux transporter outer membrane subunit [Pigmentibacter sp. JX0631]|uniref:efflux transporter outer membrane subunit n=1 Tax=Pigmentibacter sp. JX0631 TaxID=2976982 RepID=UPI0024695D0E|nr:efflux transporter outer membrane subunit [Pigmentibacter sp. JX0631]WGL60442.1 efflux transporter outer membrane subunit [Pigmentibacter sp. JX0631]